MLSNWKEHPAIKAALLCGGIAVVFGIWKLSLRQAGIDPSNNARLPSPMLEFVRQQPPHGPDSGVVELVFRQKDMSKELRGLSVFMRVTLSDGQHSRSFIQATNVPGYWISGIFGGYGPEPSQARCEIVDPTDNKTLATCSVSLPRSNPSLISSSKADPRLSAVTNDDDRTIDVRYKGRSFPGWEVMCTAKKFSYAPEVQDETVPFHQGIAEYVLRYARAQKAVALHVWRQRVVPQSQTFQWTGLKIVDGEQGPTLVIPKTTAFTIPGIGAYTIPKQNLPIKRRRYASINEAFVSATCRSGPHPKHGISEFATIEIVSPKFPVGNLSAIHLPNEIRRSMAQNGFGPVKTGELGPVTVKIHYSVAQKLTVFDATIPIVAKKPNQSFERQPASRRA